ncbi:keratin 97 [Genypterus blacodes]|uniref:keratin 97 n=1 Tax=Genypterus blacodes TaxID=154954 RepID=UPI003F75F6F4
MTSYCNGISSRSLTSYGYKRAASRAPSVYGGAGGRNVRVSYASSLSSGAGFNLSNALGEYGNNVSATGNEKGTMQNLNDRLATYLGKVRSLESANERLELQIREWYENQTPTVQDYSKYEAIIADLRKQIHIATQDNARKILQIDNARLATEDFKIKFENELAVRLSVEGDINGLRKLLDELTMTRSDLEMQIEGMKEELVYLKKTHIEEMTALRAQISSNSVNVEVDVKPQDDLSATLDAVRAQYEGITEKNRREMGAWFKVKFDALNKEMESSTEYLQSSRSEINEHKRTLQGLEIELQSQLSLKAALDGQLGETETRYSLQLGQLQVMVNNIENDLGNMKTDIERQSRDYQILLDIKTRLEMEIAEYRRLLDGEGEDLTTTVITTIEVKPKPVMTKRTIVLVEELVDGEVVSRTEDVDTQVVSK